MRAIQVTTEGILLRDVDLPQPRDGQVLVKVAGAGLCHSDCMIRDAPTVYRPDGTPFTLGHETAGWVAALGEGVSGLAPGQPVVVHSEWGCGRCPTCRAGQERYCPTIQPARGSGLGYDGGLAEFIVVPTARAVVPLPDALDPVDAGPWDDAGLTPYHVIRTSTAWLEPGSVAVVLGIGGLGHVAVQLLRALSSATIVAIEEDPERRRFALELGADHVLGPTEDAAAEVKGLCRHDGASLVLDLVGVDETLALAVAVAGTRGKVVCVGAGLGSYPFSMVTTPWECVLQTTYSGEAWELEQLLQLAATGRVQLTTRHIELEGVVEAYTLLDRGGHGTGRLIAVP